jgi:hypothetical protein
LITNVSEVHAVSTFRVKMEAASYHNASQHHNPEGSEFHATSIFTLKMVVAWTQKTST